MTTRMWKDLAATSLTALAVIAFLATHETWNVWLIGSSHRWAAVAVALLGIATCGLGAPDGRASKLLMTLGIAAAVLAVLAIATGSLTPLSLLVADTVLLWAFSTLRHYVNGPEAKPLTH